MGKLKALAAKFRFKFNKERDEEVLKEPEIKPNEIGYFKLYNVYPLIRKDNVDMNTYGNYIEEPIFSRSILFEFDFIINLEDLDGMTEFIRIITILNSHMNYYKDGKNGLLITFLIDGFNLQTIFNYPDLYSYAMVKYPEFVKGIRDAINFIPLPNRIDSASDLYYESDHKEIDHFEVNGIRYHVVRRKKYPVGLEFLSITHSLPEEPFYYIVPWELIDELLDTSGDNDIDIPEHKYVGEIYDDQPPMSIDELIEKFPDEVE